MKRVENGRTDCIEYRDTIGWGVLITLPLLLGGALFMSYCMFGAFGARDRMSGGLETIISLIVLFIQARVVWYFASLHVRRGLVVDRASGLATTSWGFLAPMFPSEHKLDGAIALRTDLIVKTHGRSRHYFDVLYLVQRGSEIELARMEGSHEFRNLCEDAAALLKLDVVTVENGEVKVLRAAEEAGKSVMEVHSADALEEVLEAAPVPTPATGRLHYERSGGGIRLELRSSGGVMFAIYLVVAAAALFAFGCFFFSEPIVWGKLIVAAFFGLPLLILYPILKPERTFVEARGGVLEVVRKGLVFSSRKAYPAASIRTIESTICCLKVDAREGLECVAHDGLSAEEQEWLRKALLAGLAAKAA